MECGSETMGHVRQHTCEAAGHEEAGIVSLCCTPWEYIRRLRHTGLWAMLTKRQVDVLLTLADHSDWRKGTSYPSRDTIAKESGYEKGCSNTALRELQAEGLVKPDGWHVTPSGGRVQRWKLVGWEEVPERPTSAPAYTPKLGPERVRQALASEIHSKRQRAHEHEQEQEREHEREVEPEEQQQEQQTQSTPSPQANSDAAAIFAELVTVEDIDQDWAFRISNCGDVKLVYVQQMVERCVIEGHGPQWLRVAIENGKYTPFKPKRHPQGESEDKRRKAALSAEALRQFQEEVAAIPHAEYRRIGDQLAREWPEWASWWRANPTKANFTFAQKILGRWRSEQSSSRRAG